MEPIYLSFFALLCVICCLLFKLNELSDKTKDAERRIESCIAAWQRFHTAQIVAEREAVRHECDARFESLIKTSAMAVEVTKRMYERKIETLKAELETLNQRLETFNQRMKKLTIKK